MTAQLQKQLNQIALWETERWAVQTLKTLKESQLPNLPALLTLLMWAIEDSKVQVEGMNIANQIMEELLTIASNRPIAAMQILLNLDDPMTETLPSLAEATTPNQIAEAMISLALDAKAK